MHIGRTGQPYGYGTGYGQRVSVYNWITEVDANFLILGHQIYRSINLLCKFFF